MNETERLAYLHAMSIDSYVPRVALPGALPSPTYAVQVPAVVETRDQSALSSQSARMKSPVFAQLREALDESAKPSLKKITPLEAATPASAQSSRLMPSAQLQFQLAIFHPVTSLLVLVPGGQLQPVHMQLLVKILQAIDIPVNTLAPVDHFEWPPRAATLERGIATVREVLLSLLEGYQHKGVRNVVVFSPSLGQMLFFDASPVGLSLFQVPELQSMLDDAQQKKTTWNILRVLKKS